MREVCRRCLRPVAHCVCGQLPRIRPATRVVILQHPREARLAICSAWLCHAALEGSELIQAVRLDEHPRVAALLAEPDTWLLFPGPGARVASPGLAPAPRTLLALDATWPQALQLLRRNPGVAALPRLSLAPGTAESGYQGLRREPEPGHLATIDAVADALGGLEGDRSRYAPMRQAFRVAVERQLTRARGADRAPRHRPGVAARLAAERAAAVGAAAAGGGDGVGSGAGDGVGAGARVGVGAGAGDGGEISAGGEAGPADRDAG